MTAAREMGFSESEAELLVSQLFRGTVELYSKSDLSCQDWIARVSSRGGTTEAAMQAYRERAVHEDIVAGAAAALQRAIALGQEG
ncbi:MAG: pyrroline-5-carboxylate reductase, partial [Lewinella sp.]|nr:pyrroline-5-carboxylate reductase [Lewinella sp.]